MQSDVQVRAAHSEDVVSATDVYLTTLEDLKRRHGVALTPVDRDDWLRGYGHILATGIFNVLTVDGRVVGVCNGVVRDSLWFLTGFWVLPEFQGKGLGRSLIDQTWKDAAKAGASQFFVWASIDLPAVGNYMRLGMLPGYQIFALTFSAEKLLAQAQAQASSHSSPSADARVISYSLTELTVPAAVAIDRIVRGTGREVDHSYWLRDPGRSGKLVLADGSPVGYFYTRKGFVGSLAYLNKEHEKPILDFSLARAATENDLVTAYIPAINRTALAYGLDRGGRLAGYSHFLSTTEFGELANYLPSGPLLY